MTKIKSLSDRELAEAAKQIALETKNRANRKTAALAIVRILKKHKLSVSDLADLDLGQIGTLRANKKAAKSRRRPVKEKKLPSKIADKRARVAPKYKNPKGSEEWTGRGRTPKWVSSILISKRISIAQFKADKRYKI
ncbi:H-NS histone family protein [Alphaproteobacteria bacterium]|nr:H-NS histone family protein [Alphaproteobacteria bacterium]